MVESDKQFPKLPASLAAQLRSVPASGSPHGPFYYPCAVELRSGEKRKCVYLCEAQSWYEIWGIWPDEDSGKYRVSLDEIRSLADSPSRLPAKFADEIYAAGESGMGYSIFNVYFSDGLSVAYGTGNAVDFVNYPDGYGPDDVTRVEPHEGRMDSNGLSCPEYYWCLFSV
jgi:hypothetical protein